MTTAEIVTSVIAILSLMVSGLTAYLTLLSRFKGALIPKRRAILTQIAGVPYVILECEFSNSGAKHGSIEDIMITIVHDETGTQFRFAPHLVRNQFDMFDRYQVSDFGVFSAVSLGSKERRELYIAFKPLLPQFSPPTSGVFTVHTSIKIDGASKWTNSHRTFSLGLNESIVQKWTSPKGEAQQIEAIEIGKSRQQYLVARQR